jgi:RimJ/RimL family protein N-acetyltransferase
MTEIELRLPTVADVEWLDAAGATPEARGEFNDFGLPRASHRERAEKGFVTDSQGTLIIQLKGSGVRLGTVDWRPATYGPDERSRAWQLGISLLPEARGKGYGGEALRLCADYLFANSNATRIEAQTDVENIAGQRAMEKAGFHREGIARAAQFRAGGLHDLVVFSRLRSDT